MKDTVLLVLTDGRWDCFQRTIDSFWAHTNSPQLDVVIIDDSADPLYTQRVMQFCPYATVLSAPQRRGFTGAIRAGWKHLEGEGYSYIFHLEDDFEFQHRVDLYKMRDILQARPDLFQLALRRGCVNPEERAVGGFMQQYPDLYHDDHYLDQELVINRRNFTTNPSMYRTELLSHGWPDEYASEQVFGNNLMAKYPNGHFAFMGNKTELPWVNHIGDERTPNGTGY